VRVAIATDNGFVSAHFGHCPEFTVSEVEDGAVKETRTVPNDAGGPRVVTGLKADVAITGGIGAGAKRVLEDNGIKVISGAAGPVDQVLRDFVAGRLVSNGSLCDHSGHHHGHGHHGGDCAGGRCACADGR